jgi:hypothetical protein
MERVTEPRQFVTENRKEELHLGADKVIGVEGEGPNSCHQPAPEGRGVFEVDATLVQGRIDGVAGQVTEKVIVRPKGPEWSDERYQTRSKVNGIKKLGILKSLVQGPL